MVLSNLIKQNDRGKVIENPEYIEFSKRTVRFGDSIYQIRNVTGFEVRKIPKQNLSILEILFILGLVTGGVFAVSRPQDTLGRIFLFVVAALMIVAHFLQYQEYGFILELNSGSVTSFISRDRIFLSEIVSALYELMEGNIDGVTVDWKIKQVYDDRSVNVYGKMSGVVSTGDNAKIQDDLE